jgi:hypothetical protein
MPVFQTVFQKSARPLELGPGPRRFDEKAPSRRAGVESPTLNHRALGGMELDTWNSE